LAPDGADHRVLSERQLDGPAAVLSILSNRWA
jgi:hypothetical protein